MPIFVTSTRPLMYPVIIPEFLSTHSFVLCTAIRQNPLPSRDDLPILGAIVSTKKCPRVVALPYVQHCGRTIRPWPCRDNLSVFSDIIINIKKSTYCRFAVYTAMRQNPSTCRDDLPILWAIIIYNEMSPRTLCSAVTDY